MRAIVIWIAVLPIVVALSDWMGSPALPTWICAGAVGVIGVLFARRRVWWLLMLPLEAAVVAGLSPYLRLDTDENIRRIETAVPPEIELS